jgi:hypothetical protein
MMLAAAFMAGVLLSGAVADWLIRRGVHILVVMNGFLAVFVISELLIILDLPGFTLPSWVMFSMTGQVAILAYPWLSSHYGVALSGRANTAMNLLIFTTAFAVQFLIGEIIDLFPATEDGGYAPEGYQFGFGLCFAAQLVAFIWYASGFHLLSAKPSRGMDTT